MTLIAFKLLGHNNGAHWTIDYNDNAHWTIYWLAVQLSCHTEGQFEFRFQPVECTWLNFIFGDNFGLIFQLEYNSQLSEKSCVDCLNTCLDAYKMTGLQVVYFCTKKFIKDRFRSIIDQLQCHEKIGNSRLICLKMLVVAVWIPVCVSVKYLSIWISNDKMLAVWKWSLW